MNFVIATAALIAAGSIAAADTEKDPQDVIKETSCDVLLWPEKMDAVPQSDQFVIAGFLIGLNTQAVPNEWPEIRNDYGVSFLFDICSRFKSLTIWEAAQIAVMERELDATSK